jgi:DedD protein
MHRRLKERLIGAAVLVMLAVIFIPMILDDTTRTESAITNTNIPARPEAEFTSRMVPMSGTTAVTTPPPAAPATGATIRTPPAGVTTTEPAADAAPAATGPAQPPPTSRGDLGLTAWVVQLGSFTNETNAEALNQELRGAGFTAFVESIRQGGSVVYRVRVGPELVRADAEALQQQLRAKLKLEGIIVAYP